MWIRPLDDADASCGAKAHGLARLIAAGLRVPAGFVVGSAAFREVAALAEVAPDAIGHALAAAGDRIAHADIPEALEREVRRRAEALGRLAVRSSASLEDGARGAAAGVFSSVTDVAPVDVWDAIRAVWTSALMPLAVAYARKREAAIEIAVIVQRFVPGARVTVYTRPAGAPLGDELWIQRGEALQRVPRASDSPEAVAALAAERAIEATQGADVELVVAALAAERAIEATQGADVELVVAADASDGEARPASMTPHSDAASASARPWVVQARPILHPTQRRRPSPPPILLAPLVRDGRRWTWDVAHNPDPLSPAQAGLVAAVDRAACTPWALQVCAGYLYTATRETPPPTPPPADRAELARRIAAIEARFVLDDNAHASADDATSLDGALGVAEAIERYVAFMQIWAGELSPLVAAARQVLLDRLAQLEPAAPIEPRDHNEPQLAEHVLAARSGHPSAQLAEHALAARSGHPSAQLAARAAALLGPRPVLRDRRMSPAWDVAVPTFAERDEAANAAATQPRREPPPRAPEPPAALATAVDLARAAADAGETDDLWFARAQWMVRRALLAHAAALGLHDDDVFWLPLDALIAGTIHDPEDAHRRASAARGAHARAAEWDMPHIVHGELCDARDAIDPRGPDKALHGVGFGTRVVGRVVRFASLAAATPVGRGDVVVTRAITPALAMIVDGCAALVSETGGLLDHGAALARELGIPCVVGCAGAWSQLGDGVVVTVDGDAGHVRLA